MTVGDYVRDLQRENARLQVKVALLKEQLRRAKPTAPFTSEEHSRRIKDGLLRARRAGRQLGRAPAIVDVGRVFALHGRGVSQRAIARELGISQPTIGRILNRSLVQDEREYLSKLDQAESLLDEIKHRLRGSMPQNGETTDGRDDTPAEFGDRREGHSHG